MAPEGYDPQVVSVSHNALCGSVLHSLKICTKPNDGGKPRNDKKKRCCGEVYSMIQRHTFLQHHDKLFFCVCGCQKCTNRTNNKITKEKSSSFHLYSIIRQTILRVSDGQEVLSRRVDEGRCGGRGRGVASALGHLCQLHVVSPEGLRSSVCAATIPHLLSSATGLPWRSRLRRAPSAASGPGQRSPGAGTPWPEDGFGE